MREAEGMSIVVRIVVRWLLGLVVVFGVAVAFFGHSTPGGGFAGGVVLACGMVMATLAFGGRAGPVAAVARLASSVDAGGALLFLGSGLVGYVAGHFLQQWIALGTPFTLGSTPCLVILNVAILLKVGGGLFAGFWALVVFGRLDGEGAGSGEDA